MTMLAILLFLLPLLVSSKNYDTDTAALGKKEAIRIIHEAEKGAHGGRRSLRRSFSRRSNLQSRRGGEGSASGRFSATFHISLPVQLGRQMTLSCNGNKALRLCVFKPPFANKATIFNPTTQLEGGRIRMSERSSGDPKICEIVVDKVERKDLGKWRCVAKCGCGGSPKGAYFAVQETPVSAAAQSTSVNSKFSGGPGCVNSTLCYDKSLDPKGKNFDGCATTTVSGRSCQAWAATTPHSHGFTNLRRESNNCRNPDGEPGPWCYTTDPDKRWELCPDLTCSKAENSDKAEEEKGEGYDCEEDGVNYLHRKATWGNYTSPGETDTWQECQKKCAENKHCKFFTWHKEESHWKKDCAIFDTFAWKDGGFLTVSGPQKCSKTAGVPKEQE